MRARRYSGNDSAELATTAVSWILFLNNCGADLYSESNYKLSIMRQWQYWSKLWAPRKEFAFGRYKISGFPTSAAVHHDLVPAAGGIFPRSSQTGPILSLIINSLFCHCSWKRIGWTHLKMSTLIEASGKRVMRPDGHIHRRPHASAMLINSMQEASSKILGFQTPPWGFMLHTGTAWVGYSNHWREVQCSCQFDYPTPNGLALRAR